MAPEAVDALAQTIATKVALAMKTSESVANQMIAFQQEDRKFKEELRKEIRTIRHLHTTAPAVAMVLAAVSLAISFYLSISISSFQTRTAADIESLTRIVRNGQP